MIPLKNGVASLLGIRFWSGGKLYEIVNATEPDGYTASFRCKVEQIA